jgi:hypothetical protein
MCARPSAGGGRCKVLAVISDPFVATMFLAAVGESSETPTLTKPEARAPPIDEDLQLFVSW